jgi:hypothetical protein
MIARALLIGLLAAAIPVVAATAQWRDELTAQLLEEKQCRIAFLYDVREKTVDGIPTVFVRAHCEDSRAFDASRTGFDGRFTLRDCQPAAC